MSRLDWARRRARSLGRLAVATTAGPLTRVHPAPVMVLGNQKSGTTAVAAVLAEVAGLDVTLDLVKEIVRPSFDRLASGQMTIDEHVRRNQYDFGRAIVKEPHLTPFADLLRQRFPDASMVAVTRHPADNIRSICDRLGLDAAGLDGAWAHHVRNNRGWQLVLDGTWLGLTGTSPLEHLCARWNLCADVAIERSDVHAIRYEDFIADRRAHAADLARRLGLGLTTSGSSRRIEERAHQPVGANRGVPAEEFFSADQLQAIAQLCGDRMVRLGHDPIG